MSEKQYIAIDLKSFYASVECVERGLDPLTTNLVVADLSRTEKTICLAVSPQLKSYGISGRAWSVSKDWSQIQIGATVYGHAGNPYGHVGIYIGGGMVAHNNGGVKVETLEHWISWYSGVCWGWENGYNLSGNPKYNSVGGHIQLNSREHFLCPCCFLHLVDIFHYLFYYVYFANI